MHETPALEKTLSPDTALACGVRELDITLIRATNYTDDGYPIQMRVGVIRSNTLTQMGTLARDLPSYPFFAGLPITVRLVDEAIQRVPAKEIMRRSREPGVKTIVMLVGVQSNQFPRAQDIASWFLPHHIPVMIGGFHVSGMLAMVGLTRDLRDAMCRGMILVAGEVEGERLPAIVEDVRPFLERSQDTALLTRENLRGLLRPGPGEQEESQNRRPGNSAV